MKLCITILATSFLLQATTGYVVHPNGPTGGGKAFQPNNKGGGATKSEFSPFQCSQVTTTTTTTAVPKNANGEEVNDDDEEEVDLDYNAALSELLQHWKAPQDDTDEQGIAFLFLSPQWAPYLKDIAQEAQERIGDESQTELVTIVGGGVVGGMMEEQDAASMSFMGGILPNDSNAVNVLFYGTEDGDETTSKMKKMTSKTTNSAWSAAAVTTDSNSEQQHNKPSHLVFADPLCSQLHDVLDELGSDIVAGAISISGDDHQKGSGASTDSNTMKKKPSLAVGKNILPPGSLIRTSFSGNIGLQVVVSHGCRPVGPTYTVTGVNGAAVHELNNMPALDQLQDTIQQADSKDQELFHRLGVLGGIHHLYHDDDDDNEQNIEELRQRRTFDIQASDALDGDDVNNNIDATNVVKLPEDFILREVNGFRPRSKSIMVCGPQIKEGDFLRFHVRSSETALQDWQSVLKRAQTERIFLGNRAGNPLAAFQISCMGRGQGLFDEETNVDLKHVRALLNHNNNNNNNNNNQEVDIDELPIAGLFANAEIGPLRLRMGAPGGIPDLKKERSYLHGYSTVVAMLCDYSQIDANSVEEILPEFSCFGNSTLDVSAWG